MTAPVDRPALADERCVRVASPLARCRACVEACPRAAWRLADGGPVLDPEACDGCGLCVPACPNAALSAHRPVAVGEERGTLVAFLACERSVVAPGPGRLACVHALGGRDLADLWRRGVRRLVVARADCSRCPRAPARPLAAHGTVITRLLAERDLAPLALEELDAEAWQRRRGRAAPAGGPASSRRGFFARALRGEDAASATPGAGLASRLPEGAAASVPWRPTLDPERCETCDACLRLCPEGALAVDDDPLGGPAYRIDGTRCTGCGLCVDLCEREAVALVAWARPARARLALAYERCSGCGARFKTFLGRHPSPGRCPVCVRAAGRRELRVVER